MTTDILDVIRTKRDGGRLSDEQVRFFIEGYTAGTVADEQAAALCMAIVLRGMAPDELATWARAMVESGERLDLSGIGRPTVDKHSTGGVGDKVSLALVPLVAACGAAVPHLAGRGLAHTGGTLDKMESIAGWRASLGPGEIRSQLASVGAVLGAAGGPLCPADDRLYALRDVTATVEAVPLIAGSIMSKKIAEGTEALVLDVKVGSGAFLPDLTTARHLAETMVELGRAQGVRTVALLTDMDAPLGRAVGNRLEVDEAIQVLRGEGPDDLVNVTLALAREMLALAGLAAAPTNARGSGSAAGRLPDGAAALAGMAAGPVAGPGGHEGDRLPAGAARAGRGATAGLGGSGGHSAGDGHSTHGNGGRRGGVDPAAALADGRALNRWKTLVRAQGGDPEAPGPEAGVHHHVPAPASGYLRRLDARALGVAVWRLGAGRSRKEARVSPTAGAVALHKPGDRVEKGEPLLVLHADDPARLADALAALQGALEVGPEPPEPRPLIIERVA